MLFSDEDLEEKTGRRSYLYNMATDVYFLLFDRIMDKQTENVLGKVYLTKSLKMFLCRKLD